MLVEQPCLGYDVEIEDPVADGDPDTGWLSRPSKDPVRQVLYRKI